VLTIEHLMRIERRLRYANASTSRQSPSKREHYDDVRALTEEVRRLWDERGYTAPVAEGDARIRAAITELTNAIIGRKP
jgi:hypothetical protein